MLTGDVEEEGLDVGGGGGQWTVNSEQWPTGMSRPG